MVKINYTWKIMSEFYLQYNRNALYTAFFFLPKNVLGDRNSKIGIGN